MDGKPKDAMTEAELDARHAEKMRKKKAARDKILATKTEERGLLIVHTGKGKRDVLAKFPDQVTIRAMGEGFSWETQDRQRDLAAARQAWDAAKELMADPSYKMVILDELNIVLRYDNLPLD